MKQRSKEFAFTYFSWLSLSIIVLEAAIIFGLIYFFVPVGELLKGISRFFGTILSILIGIRIVVWFYRETRSLLTSKSTTEGGQLEEKGSKTRSIEAALQTTDERFDEEVSRVTNWINVDEHGDITLVPEDDISDDPKYLLYVIAAKVAHELDVRNTPKVPYEELSEQVTTTFPVQPFLGKADQFLNFYYQGDPVERWSDVPVHPRKEVEVEIDVSQIERAVEWIKTGSRNVPQHLTDG
ncbi:hypothetical protein [Natrinema marinum]|uniref:hypothetical protein n=1 Tax=Natrinema marinum TaxID=2961598 RepID=UPI0020C84B4B|nr:hypothetical protein [Natrinema marinum]